MGDPDIVDPKAKAKRSLWNTCGPGVYRDVERQQQQQLDIKDEHMVDPGSIQSVFYVIATANWEKTKEELDDTALCTLALLGLREVKEAVERPLGHITSGGVTSFRRAQNRLTVVLDEVARRKEAIEKSMQQRRSLGAAPAAESGSGVDTRATDKDEDEND